MQQIPSPTSYIPRELAAEYEFIAFLKEGPRRQTILLRDRGGRQAVLKRSLDDQENLEEEYRFLKRLAGEGVPAALACFREDGRACLLREYIPGETLLDYAQKRAPLPSGEAAAIGLTLCRVLERLHSQSPPVIHRDIKAENIIRTPEGRYFLIDFGIARQYDAGARRDTQVLGTPASAPPEQFGYRQTDPRSDVYAMGVLLHELATGEPDLDQGALTGPLKPVIQRCISFDPARRYADASALARALSRISSSRRPRHLAGRRLACLLILVLLAAAFQLLPAAGKTPSGTSLEDAAPSADPAEAADACLFASPAIEAEICRQLGKEPGSITEEDLALVESLILCGDLAVESWDQLQVHGMELTVSGQSVTAQGGVDTLEDIPRLPNLRTLALCNQQIADLSPLARCGQLQRLALHGNQIGDLSPLSSCGNLQELVISGNPVSDLSPLAACPYLWSVNAGATDLTDLTSLTGLARLSRLEIHDAPLLTDVSALTGIPTLITLSLRPVSAGDLAVIHTLSQLEYLFLWHPEGMTDLTLLSETTELKFLFLDVWSLSSLEGIEGFSQLYSLDVRSQQVLDLAPLTALAQLRNLTVVGLTAESWAPLADCPALEEVLCLPEQARAIREELGEPGFRLLE